MRSLTALLCLCLAAAASAASPTLVVSDAWLRKVPGVNVAAVYFSVRNVSSQPVELVGVRSESAGHAMIHETVVEGGQSRMRPRERLVIAPGQTLKFEPGGLHVMLHGFTYEPEPGQEVALVLLLADGGEVQFGAQVRPLAGR